jgi:hypothetical protein
MIFTVACILAAIGTSFRYEDAVAQNVTLAPTKYYGRIRFGRVLFTDGVWCYATTYDKALEFDTREDAMAAWAAMNPPFAMPRGYHLFRTESSPCVTFTTTAVRDLSVVFCCLLIVALTIDYMSCVKWADMYRSYRYEQALRASRRARRARYQITPFMHAPITQPISISPTNAPSLYVATMLAEAAWARNDLCPITQEPLSSSPAVLVPPCGHILSDEAGRQPTNQCPVCRVPANYTTVPHQITVVVPTD